MASTAATAQCASALGSCAGKEKTKALHRCLSGPSGVTRRTIDGYRWIGLDRGMPNQDPAAIVGETISEADALIRLRLKEQGLELSHLVVGATPDNQIVVRSNGDRPAKRRTKLSFAILEATHRSEWGPAVFPSLPGAP